MVLRLKSTNGKLDALVKFVFCRECPFSQCQMSYKVSYAVSYTFAV